MAKIKDITGQRFGLLTAIEVDNDKIDKHQKKYWKCRCDCGNFKSIRGNDLRFGIKSCGCLKVKTLQEFHINKHNLAIREVMGKRFNSLVVTSESKKTKIRSDGAKISYVRVRCDCGKEKDISLRHVKIAKSCGCLAHRKDDNGILLSRKSLIKNKQGYIKIYKPNYPRCDKDGYVFEHIFAMSEYIGRIVTEEETVHHKNGIRDDNRIENLELWVSHHPPGQRIEDVVFHARYILDRYRDYQNPTIQDFQI